MFIYSKVALIVIAVISGVSTQTSSGGPTAGGVSTTVSGGSQSPIAGQSPTVTVSGSGAGVSTTTASGVSPSGGNTSVGGGAGSVGPGLEAYCQKPNYLYSRAFLVGDTLYFGNDFSYKRVNTADRDWKYQTAQPIQDFLANSSNLAALKMATDFGTSAECQASGHDCSYMTGVFGKLLTVVYLKDKSHAVTFYTIGQIPMTPMDVKDYPWGLSQFNNKQMVAKLTPNHNEIIINDFAYDPTTQRLYIMTEIPVSVTTIARDVLNAILEAFWNKNPTQNRFFLQYRQMADRLVANYTQLMVDNPYTAILTKNGKLYALVTESGHEKWHLLNISDGLHAVSEKSYEVKEFMNCEAPTKPSPLSSHIYSVDNTTTGPVINGSTGGSTDGGFTTPSPSPQSDKKSSIWLWILIVIIIIAIIIVIICCIFCCMKSKDDGKADNKTSKPSSAPQPTGASQTGAAAAGAGAGGPAAKSSTGAPPSKTGSGVGGQKSSAESLTTMRSKTGD